MTSKLATRFRAGLMGPADKAAIEDGLKAANKEYTVLTGAAALVRNTSYICDTSGSSFTVTLPSAPSIGDTLDVIRIGANNLIIDRNGNTLLGSSISNHTIDVDNFGWTLIYGVSGWQGVAFSLPAYVDEVDLTAGGVLGPGTTVTDNALVRFDSTTGYLVQNSGWVLDDSNVLTAGGNIDLGGFDVVNVGGITNDTTNKGSVGTGTVTFNVSEDTKQKLTVTGGLTIAFSGWPASGNYAECEIELVNGSTNVTWPTINWAVGDGTTSTTFADTGITLSAAGTNHIVVWSTDGGTTLYGVAS